MRYTVFFLFDIFVRVDIVARNVAGVERDSTCNGNLAAPRVLDLPQVAFFYLWVNMFA